MDLERQLLDRVAAVREHMSPDAEGQLFVGVVCDGCGCHHRREGVAALALTLNDEGWVLGRHGRAEDYCGTCAAKRSG